MPAFQISDEVTAVNCPYLVVPVVPTCLAGEKPYVPTPFQLQEYCKSKQSVRCPLIRFSCAPEKEGRRDSQENHTLL